MAAFDDLYEAIRLGRAWTGDNAKAREILKAAYKERFYERDWEALFQPRANLEGGKDGASYAGVITADNPTSGGYSGTSFVWMPGEGGSIAVLVIGTQGFGTDGAILARPGHRRRLRALSRIHGSDLWVKPDLLDRSSRVPETVSMFWPEAKKALQTYGDVIYAAVPVRDGTSRAVVEDLFALFFHEHRAQALKVEEKRWAERRQKVREALFPRLSEEEILNVLRARKYVVLEGPPGTGKTRAAERVAEKLGAYEVIQFHPARTYEDFVVGLAPQPGAGGLHFHVREGDLVRANRRAGEAPFTLIVDEINRADLAKVLGEAVFLLEPGVTRTVDLPHEVNGSRKLKVEPNLYVIGTRNTADRSIARMDLAIRRRFAFLPVWPDPTPVDAQGDDLARVCFADVLDTFAEFCDDDALPLVPGHAYFLDPEGSLENRRVRIVQRMRYEVVPLLREYVEARLVGPATSEIQGLVERIEARLR